MYQLTGTVKVLNDTQQITDTFKKREFVITDNSSQYPQDILFQAVQANTDKLNDVNVGDTITVSFNLRGREWVNPQGETKYFNSIQGWRIEAVQVEETPVPEGQPISEMDAQDPDDLPF